MIKFCLATTDEEYASAKALFKEYAAGLQINLDFQDFNIELDNLKKMYALPHGGILLAKDNQEAVGCAGIRRINQLEAELKRMFIKQAYQNLGIGKALLQNALQLAKQCNYAIVKLDTLQDMLPAIQLYKRAGFYEIAPYYYNPNATVIYFQKEL